MSGWTAARFLRAPARAEADVDVVEVPREEELAAGEHDVADVVVVELGVERGHVVTADLVQRREPGAGRLRPVPDVDRVEEASRVQFVGDGERQDGVVDVGVERVVDGACRRVDRAEVGADDGRGRPEGDVHRRELAADVELAAVVGERVDLVADTRIEARVEGPVLSSIAATL